jgi:hypothetical protein
MIDVGRDDGAARRDLGSYEFRRHEVRHIGAPGLTIARCGFTNVLATAILPDGDELHLRCDDAGTRVR